MNTRSRLLRTSSAGVLLAAVGIGVSCEHSSEKLERIRRAPPFPARTAVESPPGPPSAGGGPDPVDSLRLNIDRSSRWSAVAAPADEEEM